MTGSLSLPLDTGPWPLLAKHPRVYCSKYSLLGMLPEASIKGRDLVRILSEEETEVIIVVYIVWTSLWIPIGSV
jgi:hypothetical protein